MTWLERLIQTAMVDNREDFLRALSEMEYEIEAEAMIRELNELQPIMGLHAWPHGQGEDLGKAIRYMVDKDDFYERHTHTGNH